MPFKASSSAANIAKHATKTRIVELSRTRFPTAPNRNREADNREPSSALAINYYSKGGFDDLSCDSVASANMQGKTMDLPCACGGRRGRHREGRRRQPAGGKYATSLGSGFSRHSDHTAALRLKHYLEASLTAENHAAFFIRASVSATTSPNDDGV